MKKTSVDVVCKNKDTGAIYFETLQGYEFFAEGKDGNSFRMVTHRDRENDKYWMVTEPYTGLDVTDMKGIESRKEATSYAIRIINKRLTRKILDEINEKLDERLRKMDDSSGLNASKRNRRR